MIQVGDPLPEATLQVKRAAGVENVSIRDYCQGRRVLLFAVPGAFTPTCSEQHLPGYVEHAGALKAKGVEAIACFSVNDAFVMGAWGEASKAGGNVEMFADGSAVFTRALGLELDLTAAGMGLRSKRFAMLVEDNTVRQLRIDEKGLDASSAEAALQAL